MAVWRKSIRSTLRPRGLFTLLAALLCAACAGPGTRGDGLSREEKRAFQHAEEVYLKGDYEEAAKLFVAYMARFGSSPLNNKAHLYAGLAQQKSHNFDQAHAHLLQAANSTSATVATRAQMQLGYLKLRQQDFLGAALHFHEAHARASDRETLAEANLQLGIALQKGGRFAEARRILEACANDASLPALRDRARMRLEYGSYFTVQVGAFSQPANAESLIQKLSRQGFPVELRETGGDGIKLYRVISGRFSTRTEARKHRQEILARERWEENPLIVP
ncbi:MAG: SPOR domain-containing protein [Planctomycetota bacterium]